MTVKVQTFEQLALEEPTEKWELFLGRVRKKPAMTMEHYDIAFELAFAIRSQISHDEFHVRCDQGRLSTATSYLVPDVFVVSATQALQFRGMDSTLEAYADPVQFVAEVWSRSTGDYDVAGKLAEYQSRGDAEIWLIHPYEHRVTGFRRDAAGAYGIGETLTGRVTLSGLPGVSIDLDRLLGS
jgi:Uma2 family endonuclease